MKTHVFTRFFCKFSYILSILVVNLYIPWPRRLNLTKFNFYFALAFDIWILFLFLILIYDFFSLASTWFWYCLLIVLFSFDFALLLLPFILWLVPFDLRIDLTCLACRTWCWRDRKLSHNFSLLARATAEFTDLKGKVFTFPLKGPIPFDDPALRSRVTMLFNIISYMQAHLHDSGELVQVWLIFFIL
jgi:hypothetical protein